jgi:hypothetical protein
MLSVQAIKEDSSPKDESVVAAKRIHILTGVLFSKSVRSSYACLHLATIDSAESTLVVRLQFVDNQVRSQCRRFYKTGDLIILYGDWKVAEETVWKTPRFVRKVDSTIELEALVKVQQPRYWTVQKCQELQQECCKCSSMLGSVENCDVSSHKWIDRPCSDAAATTHGGLGKRQQGEYLANFLIQMIMYKLDGGTDFEDSSTWATTNVTEITNKPLLKRAIDVLNMGSGVVDAAGGSGHVSMQLAMIGCQSTVVDPREAVGKLPGRDRKLYNRNLKHNLPPNESLYCQPVPYNTYRAWLGEPPVGVDTDFRHGDVAAVPVCNSDSTLLASCSAIIALHPDEATDAIVDMAILLRKPFVIVPCCVFSRLFPHRKRPNSNEPVCKYSQLVEYLLAKDSSIQVATLPFDGANTVLWSMF